MNYEGQICRAPMERSSFMLPVTVGCPYNQCKFCNLFRHLRYRDCLLYTSFEKAQEILRGRHDAFNLSNERQSNKHLFSTLMKCKECGWSFRRTVRTYKNTYVRWVCSGRNGRGADSCPNKTVVDEEELIEVLQEYFTNVLKQKKKVIAHVVNEFQRVYKAKDENVAVSYTHLRGINFCGYKIQKYISSNIEKVRKKQMKYLYMNEQERQMQYYQFPKFLLELRCV